MSRIGKITALAVVFSSILSIFMVGVGTATAKPEVEWRKTFGDKNSYRGVRIFLFVQSVVEK